MVHGDVKPALGTLAANQQGYEALTEIRTIRCVKPWSRTFCVFVRAIVCH